MFFHDSKILNHLSAHHSCQALSFFYPLRWHMFFSPSVPLIIFFFCFRMFPSYVFSSGKDKNIRFCMFSLLELDPMYMTNNNYRLRYICPCSCVTEFPCTARSHLDPSPPLVTMGTAAPAAMPPTLPPQFSHLPLPSISQYHELSLPQAHGKWDALPCQNSRTIDLDLERSN